MAASQPLENMRETYNLGPAQHTMVVRIDPHTGKRALTMTKWGLVPPWSKTGKMEYSTIIAKSENVEKAATFRDAFKARRCFVPADNTHEWKKLDDSPKPAKQPYAIARADGLPLFLAGLWETWRGGQAVAHLHHPDDGTGPEFEDGGTPSSHAGGAVA
jgi:putative SOS response-associated peptidase YedK